MTTPDSTPSTPSTPGVYAAFVAAMQEIGAVGKDSRNEQGWMFRGIDAVMNAVGPAFRKHGLFLLPEVLDHNLVATPRERKSPVISATVKVRYSVVHSDGSSFSGVAPGEGNDFSDKATAKAMSVALRTFLIQSLVLPTDEEDPDAVSIERGVPPQAARVTIPDDWQDWVQAAEMDGDVNTLEVMESQATAAGNNYAASTIRAAKLRAKRNGPQTAPGPSGSNPNPDAPQN